jgi:hypothetical protein
MWAAQNILVGHELRATGIERRPKLKWMLEKQGVGMWMGSIWLQWQSDIKTVVNFQFP